MEGCGVFMVFRRVRSQVMFAFFLVFMNGQIDAVSRFGSTTKDIGLPTEDTLVFVILRHVREEADNALWRKCYNSIKEFYSETPIVIIDDNSKVVIAEDDLENTAVIKSEYPGAGELLPYYYFLKYRWADKMVFLHDSMFLKRKFSQTELSYPIQFHWHFQNHEWDEDTRINDLLLNLSSASALAHYNSMKFLWHGCFGVASIVSLSVLDQIEDTYSFTSGLIDNVKTRSDRMALERIFAILLFKEGLVTKKQCSNFGSIFEHPLAWQKMSDTDLEKIKLTCDNAIIKTWQGR